MTPKELDIVRLTRALPDHALEAGATGTIVMVYRDPPGYEIEFADADGLTIALLSVDKSEAEGMLEIVYAA